jgi:hypothetical protein
VDGFAEVDGPTNVDGRNEVAGRDEMDGQDGVGHLHLFLITVKITYYLELYLN